MGQRLRARRHGNVARWRGRGWMCPLGLWTKRKRKWGAADLFELVVVDDVGGACEREDVAVGGRGALAHAEVALWKPTQRLQIKRMGAQHADGTAASG